MALWLMKSEPDVFSIDDLARKETGGWDGVRNYEARNFMKAMKAGDKVLFYHSNALPPGVAGTAEVCREAYPDPTQFDPKDGHYDPKAVPDKPIWFQVDLRFTVKFKRFVPLDELRGAPELADMKLFKRSRLSVIPVTAAQWKSIIARGKAGLKLALLCLLLGIPAAAKPSYKPEKPFEPAIDAPKIVRAWIKKSEGKDHLLAFQDEATGERRRLKLRSLHPAVTTLRVDDLRMWGEFRDQDGAKHKVLLEIFLTHPDGDAWRVDHAETFSVDGNPRKPYNEGYTAVPPSAVIRRRTRKAP